MPDGRRGDLRLEDDFDGGVLSPIWDRTSIESDSLVFVRPVSDQSRPAVAITVRTGQVPMTGGHGLPTERAELREAPRHWVPFGRDIWYGFALYFPADFPILDTRLVVGQWLQLCPDPVLKRGRSPVLAQRYRAGVFHLTVNTDAGREILWSHDGEVRGRWLDFVYHLRLVTGAAGLVRGWMNGDPIVRYEGPVGYADDAPLSYFKVGLYRDTLPDPMTVYVTRFRRGPDAPHLDSPMAPRIHERQRDPPDPGMARAVAAPLPVHSREGQQRWPEDRLYPLQVVQSHDGRLRPLVGR
jgi:hypothetical protein